MCPIYQRVCCADRHSNNAIEGKVVILEMDVEVTALTLRQLSCVLGVLWVCTGCFAPLQVACLQPV